jgi:hypothetical protein
MIVELTVSGLRRDDCGINCIGCEERRKKTEEKLEGKS